MSHNIPQDSVLKRHYEAAQRMAADSDRSSTKAAPTEIKPKQADPVAAAPSQRETAASSHSHSHSSHSHDDARGGGFFGWLKRLLGG